MQIGISLSMVRSSAVERAAKAFTSAKSGNWNAADTWTSNSDYPRLAGDTVTIASTHTVTIPSGVAISVGAVTASAGANTIQVNGSLRLNGNLVPGSSSKLNLGPGATLNLNGFNVAAASACFYNFAGTEGSRCTVIGGGGRFIGGNFSVIPTITYTDFSDLGDSSLGRTHTAASGFVTFEHCTVTDCAYFGLEDTGTGANAGFSIRHNDFRNPSPADPETGADYQPFVYITTAIGSQERAFVGNTFETSGIVNGVAWLRGTGMTSSDNVFSNWKLYTPSTANGSVNFDDNFFNNTKNTAEEFFKSSGGNNEFSRLLRNYFYYTQDGHPFGALAAGRSFDATYNVFEMAGDNAACNWFLWSTLTGTVNIKNNIWLGAAGAAAGVPVTFTGNGAPTLLDFSNNTIYIDNKNTTLSLQKVPLMLLTEQTSTIAGTVNLYNNLLVDPDDTTTMDPGVDLKQSTANQVDVLNYQGAWGYPGGAKVLTHVNVAGGANDVSADPDFVDRTRNIAAWDASLGGPGTAAHAIAEMLKRNDPDFDADYTPAALVLYVQGGFVPQASDYDGVGRDAGNIGFRMAA